MWQRFGCGRSKAQHEELMAILAEIRDALVPRVESVEEVCAHPEEQRVNFGTFTNIDAWICKACKHKHNVVLER